jgi:hypothetical protein
MTTMSGTEERDQDDIKLVPEVVITSSTRETREKLRSMGVKLVLLERWEEAKGEFQESIIDSAQSQANDRKGVDASPAVKAELAALRRAQVYGQTVGADVSIDKPRSVRSIARDSATRGRWGRRLRGFF